MYRLQRIIPSLSEISASNFLKIFQRILEFKKRVGFVPFFDNPKDLFERAKLYGNKYKNGSWGWASNIWHRSAANTAVINDDSELRHEHKVLLLRVLEHILAQGPLIKVDAYVGKPKTKAQMHARLWCDPQFPDIAYRWSQLYFPAPSNEDPDVEIFHIPHYLGNPTIEGTNKLLMVMRFPHYNFTIITCSSYQGETKKAVLSHWIYQVYRRGGTGEHASLKEMTVKTVNGKEKRVVMCFWGLTGTGKSTHGLYIFTRYIAEKFVELFGIDPLDYVLDQKVKNDDIVAIFEDIVIGSERNSWTKTEDITPEQEAMWRGATSPRALHENTEPNEEGYPSFNGEIYQYFGKPNKNSRSVVYLEDTGYFDGDVASSGPLSVAVFLSPGYFTDYAWIKVEDVALAAKIYADGRTIGHPAQSKDVVGKIRYVSRFCKPFTIGVRDTEHVIRFYKYLKARKEKGDPVDVFVLNTTGRIIAKYKWVEKKLGDKIIKVPEPILVEKNGIPKAVGGTRPSIEETELFLLQAIREAIEWEPHPVWGEKVLIPKSIPGLSDNRIKELYPATYLSYEEFKRLLKAQIEESKYWLEINCPRLKEKLPEVFYSMDFED